MIVQDQSMPVGESISKSESSLLTFIIHIHLPVYLRSFVIKHNLSERHDPVVWHQRLRQATKDIRKVLIILNGAKLAQPEVRE